ncbi:MAG: ribosome small subunit-dependent GTPase A [Actinomycetota bacterium]|nr:ribosome small subunit-dependent GTPase A [Actinomycetota bacterium]
MTQSFDLRELGWNPELERHMESHRTAGFVPGRVAVQHRGGYVVYTESGETAARLPGRMRHEEADLPAVGDWLALRELPNEPGAVVEAVLPRASKFSRNEAGKVTREQVVAANVDVAFLVAAMNQDLNTRRLERYMTTAWSGGASPVIVLTKPDLCDDLDGALAEVESVALGVPVHVVNGLTGEGVETVRGFLAGNKTVALLGSSGAGKSTLLNHLAGTEVQRVQDIRHDGRGRHTTTVRHLFPIPGGGLVLDTPGMRELQLWASAGSAGDTNERGDGVDQTFTDVAELAAGCRFDDCTHEHEPGCAVMAALEDGRLSPERLASYHKLQRELRHLRLKQDRRAAAEQRRQWKVLTKSFRRA